jgi:two-component system cell cycle response regulator
MDLEHKRVLVVDDDPAMLRILSVWLEKAGYQVQTFEDARLAFASIESDPPDFLITDWEMPHMTGLELCHHVRELKLSHYIYTIFLTVRSAPNEMIEGLEIGADDFLAKPIHQGELLARVRAGARIVELERRLGMMARTDYLTGLMTQRVFYEALDKEWARVERSGAPLSCVMADIDFFKKVNDVYGHPSGDAVLRAIADLLRNNSRANDIPCRYGGEEFCILLPETTEGNAAQWAERIRQQLAQTVVSTGGHEIQVTGSFGVAQRRDDTSRAEALVDHADQALLYAKQSGRSRVVRYESLAESLTAGADSAGLSSLFANTKARQVMSPIVTCLQTDDTIGQAAEFFLRLRLNSACVLDAEGQLAGILSEKDLLGVMDSLDCWAKPIGEVMKPKVVCYDEDTPIQTIYQFLCRVSIRRVVILSGSRPVGTISRATLLRWFCNLALARGLRAEAAGANGWPRDGAARLRHRLIGSVDALDRCTAGLRECLERPSGQRVSGVAGQATRIQRLVQDLLAYSALADETFPSCVAAAALNGSSSG